MSAPFQYCGASYSRMSSSYTPEIIVPQRPYAANIQRNHTHSIGVVEFWVNGQKGIRLSDAQARIFTGLAHADDRLLEGFGVKVTYRIEWPGYGAFGKQKHALRATREKESITRAKMAIHVAEVMKDFIEEMTPLSTSDPSWRVGERYIEFEDLYLLEIHHVAKASLQPVIAYRPRYVYPQSCPPPTSAAAYSAYPSYGWP
ncbi:uncharacterized protein PHACADRAFT_254932 [Phanerochaete carnosa HHB-10118-sp]|uniref:Uncharacterized protein n=1 Tax=Phanerochaete carnosa (strain HHB-10118-sp) TaxID=650164 RepID=K5X369_PHACS|nr:uncharacterized protein PHACADRAFT_254932 [Phanerochaete carnosa HHB-10118-sp]EKM57257.1 hypothetical protein PHACADRAFT_254932 [Phanerochaete carnosa HHB-10118-sp]